VSDYQIWSVLAMPHSSAISRPARRGLRWTGVVALIAGGALFGLPGVASAHVTAQPGSAAPGGYTLVSFRTPNEEDTAATVKLEVSFPTDHPIASASVEAVPGWTATVDKAALATPIKTDDGEVNQAVSKITWSGGQLGPGAFQDFPVLLGPLPSDTDKLVFKAVQTYSNGDVVRWIDVPAPGAPEPEHPAPTVALTAAPGADLVSTTQAAGDPPHAAHSAGGSPPAADRAGAPVASAGLILGILGCGIGGLGAVLGGLALRRSGPG
jgi:uncharacterized protein YcnI